MIGSQIYLIISSFAIITTFGLPCNDQRIKRRLPKPPKFIHRGIYDKDYDRESIAENIRKWTSEDKENPWELSGLYEGDIMLYPSDEMVTKNGLVNDLKRWPGGIVPYFIEEDDFTEDQLELINGAIKEYHEKTCLRFRPYNETDKDYVLIQGSEAGCWSAVGRKGEGQVLNLQKKGCVKHGTIVHELLHAVGFYHQQSSTDRDDYVKIHWENIKPGKEHNFNKYDKKQITDFGIGYDYGSVMHYSGFAFSKNKNRTISPLDEDAKIGQRQSFSEKDIAKLQAMYKEECGDRKPEMDSKDIKISLNDSLDWWLDLSE